ncbi:MAG: hypothetical protein ACE5KM_01935 [Planctomycetaceae bacterium]
MRRVNQLATATVLAVVLSVASTWQAVAAPASSQPPPAFNTEDLYYDFEVYMADDVTVYYVTYELKSGRGGHAGFDTLAEAEAFEAGLWQSGQVKSVDQSVYQGPSYPWEYVTTFDKRADAEQFAAGIEGMGFYAKVERIYAWAPSYQTSR